MKNYIFLTPSIAVLGGAELYCLRRGNYLLNKKHRVIFITGEKDGESNFLSEFKDFERISLEGLPLFYLGIKSKLFKKMIEEVSNLNLKGETYIESHNVNCFLWGESLSLYIKAKHIFYILAEFDINKYKPYLSYLRKGLHSGRLIGITNQSLKICFPKEKKIEQIKNYVNVAFSKEEFSSEITENVKKIIDRKVDYRILTISRLEKTYIEELILSTIEISKKYSYRQIELIIVGDTKDGEEKRRLENKYKSINNFTIHFLGYINPVSEEVFRKSNVFVGMGTAAVNAISAACSTIIIDPRNNLSPGYFGDGLCNFAFSENGKYIDLSELLIRGLSDGVYLENLGKKSENIFYEEFDSLKSMEKLDQFYEKIEFSKLETNIIKPSFKHKFFAFILKNSLLKIYKKFAEIMGRERFLKI